MNYRTMLTTCAAVCLLAGPAAAQDPPAPRAAPPGAFPGVPLQPAAPPALAPPGAAPPSGLLWILGGSGLVVAGAANLATAPLCITLGNLKHPDQCAAVSVAFGVAFAAAGIPLLVVGARKRAAFLEWERSRGAPVVTSSSSSASLAWRWSW